MMPCLFEFTRQRLQRLHNDGDISSEQVKAFYTTARKFYITAATYSLTHLPIDDYIMLSLLTLTADCPQLLFSQVM